MKIIRCYYDDDGVLIPGLLIVSLFKKVFYPSNTDCGWNFQRIYRKNKNLIKKG